MFLRTPPVASLKMENIEGIRIPSDHILGHYFSSYFYLICEVCDEQHDHTHQLGEIFVFTEECEMYYLMYRKVEVGLNVIHNIDKK